LTWKLVSFFHNCVMSYAQWYIWNEKKFSNWNSYMPDIKILCMRILSIFSSSVCDGRVLFQNLEKLLENWKISKCIVKKKKKNHYSLRDRFC
jgi:hypothetical protein